ncbi:MAG: nucleotide exchange factor GrpE [Betaproteobacteria bacterium]
MQHNVDPPVNPAASAESAPVTAEKAGAETVVGAPPADPAPDFAALLKKVEAEAAELRDAWLRARADLDNQRKQAAADIARAHKFALERIATELLPVKDGLESTLAAKNATPDALRAGVELTLKQLAAVFEKAQIVEIEAAGLKFDPHRHQAMTMVDSAEPAHSVVQVFQKGYALNDRVLRPAMVAVAKPHETGA